MAPLIREKKKYSANERKEKCIAIEFKINVIAGNGNRVVVTH